MKSDIIGKILEFIVPISIISIIVLAVIVIIRIVFYMIIMFFSMIYLRNKERIINKKKISEKDDNYFNKAEDYLYTELGVVFNMSKENIKEYIIEKLK